MRHQKKSLDMSLVSFLVSGVAKLATWRVPVTVFDSSQHLVSLMLFKSLSVEDSWSFLDK